MSDGFKLPKPKLKSVKIAYFSFHSSDDKFIERVKVAVKKTELSRASFLRAAVVYALDNLDDSEPTCD